MTTPRDWTKWRKWFCQRIEDTVRAEPRRVINATGVIIHTNLGRAPLSRAAILAAEEAAQGYSNLEFDLESGTRGSRQARVQALLRQLTGAEAALVVNNNASAVLLGLSALAVGREVVVSRAEAVEIGGGFRVPDVLRQSGCVLVDVGTTNRTYVRDYEEAATDNTAAFLKVHASNFRVEGFTAEVTTGELAALGDRLGVATLHDVGSGSLLSTAKYGLAHEPTPQESIQAGMGLVFFSGDKLLGGPQAGIVAGKGELVGRLARHPLARAVRIDKLSLASLTATLVHYLKGEAEREIPVWRMISTPMDVVGGAGPFLEGGVIRRVPGGRGPVGRRRRQSARRDAAHLVAFLGLPEGRWRRAGRDGTPAERSDAGHCQDRRQPGAAGPAYGGPGRRRASCWRPSRRPSAETGTLPQLEDTSFARYRRSGFLRRKADVKTGVRKAESKMNDRTYEKTGGITGE